MLDFVLNFLFPPVCGICGKLNEDCLCDKCKKRLKKYEKFELISDKEKIDKLFKFRGKNIFIKDSYGNTLNKEVWSLKNKDIKNYHNIYFDEFLYCFQYEKLIRNLLLKYKFYDCAYLSNMFGFVILNNKKINEIFKKYDIIIPVPMDKKKKAKRGYNQTELITKYFEKKFFLNIENVSNWNEIKTNELNKKCSNILIKNETLIKNKFTKTQSTLNAEERTKNIEGAFKVKNIDYIQNKKIILFDDIATTGSTVNEISKILKNAGARKILVLVIAKD